MLLCVNSQHLIFSLYLSLSFPSCSHCFPSLSLFSSLPSPPCPYFFLLSLLTPSRPRLPSFSVSISSPCTPSVGVDSRLLLRSVLPSITAQLAGVLLACVFFSFRHCLLFPYPSPSPFFSSAPPHILSPAPPASPSLLRVVPLLFVLSLGQPPWALSLISSRCIWVLLQSAPSFLLLSSFTFLLLPTAPLCLPHTFRFTVKDRMMNPEQVFS